MTTEAKKPEPMDLTGLPTTIPAKWLARNVSVAALVCSGNITLVPWNHFQDLCARLLGMTVPALNMPSAKDEERVYVCTAPQPYREGILVDTKDTYWAFSQAWLDALLARHYTNANPTALEFDSIDGGENSRRRLWYGAHVAVRLNTLRHNKPDVITGIIMPRPTVGVGMISSVFAVNPGPILFPYGLDLTDLNSDDVALLNPD